MLMCSIFEYEFNHIIIITILIS